MHFSFGDLVQLDKDFNQIWPLDLLTDLEEEEPLLYQEYQELQSLLFTATQEAEKREEEGYSPLAPLHSHPQAFIVRPKPSLVTPGWNQIHKGRKNWADFQNLLFFYALGKIQIAYSRQALQQKQTDTTELRSAIEEFPILKNEKPQTAEERIKKGGTYLTFGKRFLDALFNSDPYAQYDLNREIQDAQESNHFNADKLKISKNIAVKVFNTLKNRYNF